MSNQMPTYNILPGRSLPFQELLPQLVSVNTSFLHKFYPSPISIQSIQFSFPLQSNSSPSIRSNCFSHSAFRFSVISDLITNFAAFFRFFSAMTTPPLKAVTLTHVRYQRGDQFGHFLAWVSLVPIFISLGGFVSHFIFRRELQGMFFAVGLLISEVINQFIKTSVQQARPETCALLEVCGSHGWPSSHSQYMFFFAMYLTLMTSWKIGFWYSTNNLFLNFLTWSLAILTMYSRVYLGYHTVGQVFAGATLGIFLGALWFWIVNSQLSRYFPAIEESAFGRQFYVKDTSHIRNVLKFEYDHARAERVEMAANSKSD